MNSELDQKEIEDGEQWFEMYVDSLNNRSIVKPSISGVKYTCPCCSYLTLKERGGFNICPVCFWEDDGQDDQDADVVRGGPNGSKSLSSARKNYLDFKACDRRFISNVREPMEEEFPSD